MLFGALPATVFAAEKTNPLDYLTYEIADGEVTIPDCDTSVSGELTIPETIEGYPVTGIGEWAFENCTDLTNVTIPDSVIYIGSGGLVLWADLYYGFRRFLLHFKLNCQVYFNIVTRINLLPRYKAVYRRPLGQRAYICRHQHMHYAEPRKTLVPALMANVALYFIDINVIHKKSR